MYGLCVGVHRRLALAVGAAVLVWCFSGAVMLGVPYPSLTESEWFDLAPPLSVEGCCFDLERVVLRLERLPGIEQLRLIAVGGRPAAVARYLDGSLDAVWGDTQAAIAIRDEAQVRSLFETPRGKDLIDEVAVIEDDVWTVHQRFDPHRPLWKLSLAGEEGLVLYVSSTTGDVVQDTHTSERRWNLVGAVAHWWYLPWLRRQWVLWDQALWWVGGLSTLMALTGVWLSASHLLRHGGKGLFGGSRGLHRPFGMIGGLAAACWIASGWLSMDHGRWFSDGKVSALERERAMGGRMTVRDVAGSSGLLAQMAAGRTVKEIRLTKVAGGSYAILRESPSRQFIVALTDPKEPVRAEFSDETVRSSIRALFEDKPSQSGRRYSEEDHQCGSALVRTGQMSVVRVECGESVPMWVDVDARTGTILEVLDPSRRIYHRLFDLLHRWDVPWFARHDDIRRILMGGWCLMGMGLVGTGFWMWGAGRWRGRRSR